MQAPSHIRSPRDPERAELALRRVRVPLAVLLVAFALWSVALLLDVRSLRAELEARVRWLARAQHVQSSLRGGDAGPERPEPFASAREALGLLQDERAARSAAGTPGARELAQARDALAGTGGTGPGAAIAALDRFVVTLRAETSDISRRLGDRWRSLSWLVAGSLLLAAATLGLTEVLVREHRRMVVLRERAGRDHLTGVLSRRAILELLERELERARRQEHALGVLMIDLDGFKAVNDRWGHAAGDEVLVRSAERLEGGLRPYDSLGRYGGDEFLVVLPDCDEDSTRVVAERLREAFDAGPRFTCRHAPASVRLTVSVGAAVSAPEDDSPQRLLAAADAALLEAKRGGRNACALAAAERASAPLRGEGSSLPG